jgi:hypothetical protein
VPSCQGKGFRVIAAGASARVIELFKLTKMDGVITTTGTVDDADIHK